jgi:hypothetical protein
MCSIPSTRQSPPVWPRQHKCSQAGGFGDRARKGEHDIALGNVIGSNMFNVLAVIGIAGAAA